MALWQSFKIASDPSLAGKGYTAVPTIINLVQHNSTHAKLSLSEDEKKWQWAVRCKPDPDCPHSCKPKTKCIKRQSWIAWLMRKKPEEIIVDKENCPPRGPEKWPKIWEWEYYSYLLPDSYLAPKPSPESCRIAIVEQRRKQLDRDSLECLNRNADLYLRNALKEREMPCEIKKEKKRKKTEPQPCPPPLPRQPKELMLKNCQSATFSANRKPATFDEYEVRLPYEDKPLKVTDRHPKQYSFKSKVKTEFKSFPPVSEEELKLLCRLDYNNAQFKYVECPPSMYLRFKDVSKEEDGFQPISCKCTIRPIAKGKDGKPVKPPTSPCESGESYWSGSTGGDDMFKCRHPLDKMRK